MYSILYFEGRPRNNDYERLKSNVGFLRQAFNEAGLYISLKPTNRIRTFDNEEGALNILGESSGYNMVIVNAADGKAAEVLNHAETMYFVNGSPRLVVLVSDQFNPDVFEGVGKIPIHCGNGYLVPADAEDIATLCNRYVPNTVFDRKNKK